MRLTLPRSKLEQIRHLCANGIRLLEEREADARACLVPNLPVDIVDWMHANIYLPPEVTERPGPLRLNKLQQGVFRAFQEPGAEWISFQKPPRFGASMGTVAAMLYYAAHEGIDVFYTERAEHPFASYVSKKMLRPMLTAEAGGISHLKRPDGKGALQDTWMDTHLTNGASVQIRSAATDGAFRQLRAGLIVLDECSNKAYQAGGAGSEGDKPSLAWARGQTVRKPIMFLPSTPTEEGSCIVSREYKRSDQRVYFVRCPHCHNMQPLLPNVGNKTGAGIKFNYDEAADQLLTYADDDGNEMPDVWYECAAGGCEIRETSKAFLIASGEWRATRKPDKPGLIGFYTWAAYSDDPQSTWANIALRWVEQKRDVSKRQPFKNLTLALPWERQEQRVVPINVLQARARPYDAPCPAGVKRLTWGLDSQRGKDDGSKKARSEMVVLGWGFGEECWVLAHFVIDEVPFSTPWKREVYRLHDLPWRKADGKVLKASAGGVDVGYDFDHAVQFCHEGPSKSRNIRAVKGENSRALTQTGILQGKSEKNELWTFLRVPKQSPTDLLMMRLRQETAGPGSIHFPTSLPTPFYEGLTAVQLVVNAAKTVKYWQKDAENSEVYDCWIYAYAILRMLMILSPEVRTQILVPSPRGAESAEPSASEYKGDDRSANSALTMALQGTSLTVKASAPARPAKPAFPSGSKQPEYWNGGMRRSEPPQGKPGRPPMKPRPGNRLVTW